MNELVSISKLLGSRKDKIQINLIKSFDASVVSRIVEKVCKTVLLFNSSRLVFTWPGQFPGIAEKAGNRRNVGKVTKYLTKLKLTLKKLCLGKISGQKTVRIKFSVCSAFSNMFYGKNRKHGNARNQQKAFWIKKHPVVTVYHY